MTGQLTKENLRAGKNIIRIHSGRYINPFDIKEGDIDIEDIAHSLSMQCRFAGHTQRFYSVAEHSIDVFNRVSDKTNAKQTMLEALLHDASEAYLLDIPSPYKAMMGEQYHKADQDICNMVAFKFGLANKGEIYVMHEDVKAADYEALVWEWGNIVTTNKMERGTMKPKEAKDLFLKIFNELS